MNQIKVFLERVNFLSLAKSAQRIGHHVTSIMFLEVEAKKQHQNIPMFEILEKANGEMRDLLLTAYRYSIPLLICCFVLVACSCKNHRVKNPID